MYNLCRQDTNNSLSIKINDTVNTNNIQLYHCNITSLCNNIELRFWYYGKHYLSWKWRTTQRAPLTMLNTFSETLEPQVRE